MPHDQPVAGAIESLWQWLKSQFVQTVPKDIAVCEFDCRELQCLEGEWETCEKRLAGTPQKRKPAAIPEADRAKTGTHG
jgi:hypothetical protein